MRKIIRHMGIGFIWFGIGLCSVITAIASTDTREWAFRVYLDDSEIGSHRFLVTDSGNGREIRTEAEFDVKFMFFSVYKYRHWHTESWEGNCLKEIESETDANGDRYSVLGSVRGRSFIVSAMLDNAKDQSTLPECVATFAYWDPDFLLEPRLLNTQTGEYVNVEAELVGKDLVSVRNQLIPAFRYRLTGNNLEIELWYSHDRSWIALESVTKGGRRLRYELT